MFTTYKQALSYLFASLPMFQRVGAIAYVKDLSNTIKLCEALGNPHKKFKSIHVAGTNGKGSTSHMLASILQSSGYKTGLYTSPHLKDFTERIKITGEHITQDFVVEFVNKIKPQIEVLHPSFFEITVAMAFEYFAQQKVDIAVIEVGMGGRLDSTNVISPVLSVITNIGFDHKEFLGDTLEKIANEKAGIIKTGTPVVVSERQLDVEHVFVGKAKECASSIYFAQDYFTVNEGKNQLDIYRNKQLYASILHFPLKGIYQSRNIIGVLQAVSILRSIGFVVKESNLVTGLENTIVQTGLKGRWQQLGENPTIICDTGHNEDGVREVLKQISKNKFHDLHIVWGMVKDKETDDILRLLPKNASYYFCQAKIPRALDATLLHDKASNFGLLGKVVPDVNDAIRKAVETAGKDDFIFVGGSTFVVAEIENL